MVTSTILGGSPSASTFSWICSRRAIVGGMVMVYRPLESVVAIWLVPTMETTASPTPRPSERVLMVPEMVMSSCADTGTTIVRTSSNAHRRL